MARGGKRPGAGRPRGSSNKVKAMDIKAIKEGQTPLDYLVGVYQDNEADAGDRLRAATAAAPYVHARMTDVTLDAQVEHSGEITEIRRVIVDSKVDTE